MYKNNTFIMDIQHKFNANFSTLHQDNLFG